MLIDTVRVSRRSSFTLATSLLDVVDTVFMMSLQTRPVPRGFRLQIRVRGVRLRTLVWGKRGLPPSVSRAGSLATTAARVEKGILVAPVAPRKGQARAVGRPIDAQYLRHGTLVLRRRRREGVRFRVLFLFCQGFRLLRVVGP